MRVKVFDLPPSSSLAVAVPDRKKLLTLGVRHGAYCSTVVVPYLFAASPRGLGGSIRLVIEADMLFGVD